MIWLALAIACSLGIATLFKVSERRNLDRTALLTVNYAAGAVLAAALQGVGRAGAIDAGLVGLGVAQGVLFIGGFWLFSLAIRRAGMGLAAGVMRLSVVLPVVASAVVWSEAVSPFQMAGLVLAGVAFFLVARPAGAPRATTEATLLPVGPHATPGFYHTLDVPVTATAEEIKRAFRGFARRHHPDRNPSDPSAGERFQSGRDAYETLSDPAKRSAYDQQQGRGLAEGVAAVAGPPAAPEGRRTLGLLALLFVAGGLVDVLNKAFTETYAGAVPESLFLLFVFGVAFGVGAVAVVASGVRTGRWPTPETIAWGVLLGLINYGSADFFLRAIGELPAPFVFPANSVSIVFGAALIGRLAWRERLSRANVAGLAVAAAALVLLAQ